MDNYTHKMKHTAPSVLRISVSLVFLWFGSEQLMDASSWVGFIPKGLPDMLGLSSVLLVHFNGAFEVVFGLCLLLGYFTRTCALLLTLHLLSIAISLGYGPLAIRDFGLSLATLSVFLYGADRLTLDYRRLSTTSNSNTNSLR